MLFSERQKLEKEYYKWLVKNKNVKPCPLSLITFIDTNGNLINNNDRDKIAVLEKALELACEEIFNKTFPSLKNSNYKHSKLMCFYKNEAKKHLGDKNE